MRILDRIMVVLYMAVAALPFAAMKLHWHDHEIFGSLPPAPHPDASFAAFRSEDFQKAYTAWFESNLGFKGYQIAVDNTLLYHVLRDTKSGSQVMLGKDGFLFKDEDIAYYNKGAPHLPDQAHVDALADKVADIQARMQKQGRAFVPLIIPSKTTIYRDKVPDLWTRPLGDPRPSDLHIYAPFIRALDARKVIYVDARAMFLSGQIPRDQLWTIHARHWSEYGACLAMREVDKAYIRLTGRPGLAYECPLEIARKNRTWVDFDLWRLLNIWGLPRQPERVPLVDHTPPPPADLRPSLMVIGTSFQWGTLRDAAGSQRFSKMYMNYYNKLFVEWPRDVHTQVTPFGPEWRAVMLDNDLYVLDLFEVFLLAPDTYVDEVLDQLGSEIGGDDAGETSGAAISSIHDLGLFEGAHYIELWGTFPGTRPYRATVTCDGIRRTTTVYYQNPNGQQLNIRFPDPGIGTCERGQAPARPSGVSCTFTIGRGSFDAPPFGPRRVCPGPQGDSGQDADGQCRPGLGGC